MFFNYFEDCKTKHTNQSNENKKKRIRENELLNYERNCNPVKKKM